MLKSLGAEFLGTFWLVLGGCGSAVLAAKFPEVGIGLVGVSFAFGLTVLTMAYAVGRISGGHFNPAVTLGLAVAGRFPWRRVPAFLAVQAIGALVATTLLVLVGLFGPDGWLTAAQDGGFASTGWGSSSPGGFGVGAAVLAETLLAALFVLVLLGTTHPVRGTRSAALAIGLAYVALQLVLLPVDGGGLNPARSLATAVYGGTPALAQLWVFVVFPALGAMAAGLTYRALFDGTERD
jgi:aquaporin Z